MRGLRVFEGLRGIPGIVNRDIWACVGVDDTDSVVVGLSWNGRAETGGNLDPGIRHRSQWGRERRSKERVDQNNDEDEDGDEEQDGVSCWR